MSALTIVVVRWSISTCVAHNHCTYLRWGSLAWFNQAYPAPYGQVCREGCACAECRMQNRHGRMPRCMKSLWTTPASTHLSLDKLLADGAACACACCTGCDTFLVTIQLMFAAFGSHPFSNTRQIWAFVLLAVVGGWVASVFTAFNTWLCLLRKKWSKWFSFRILEVRKVLVQYQLSTTAILKSSRCSRYKLIS